MICCGKKVFDTAEEAQARTREINKLHRKGKGQKKLRNGKEMRFYKCKECGKFLLTSMSKEKHRFHTSPTFRKKLKFERFLERETEHWKKKLGIKD